MPARQYIGARYVTKVYENSQDPGSAEWESGINYEPLTMVTYNMGSYISKKEVPASVGDPASNTQYWTQTGFYNGQIAWLDSIKQNKDLNTPLTIGGNTETNVEDSLGALNTELDKKVNSTAFSNPVEDITGTCQKSSGYSAGDIFLASDQHFYRTEASIANGAAFTVGTNVTQTLLDYEISIAKDKIANLEAHGNGSSVDISSYSSTDNKYTIPRDGYLVVSARGSTSNITVSAGGGIEISIHGQGTNDWLEIPIFMKKDMRIYISSSSGTIGAAFVPLVI